LRDCVVIPFMVRQASSRAQPSGSPRTEHDMLEINHLAVRPEPVEGPVRNYDTVSKRGWPGARGCAPHPEAQGFSSVRVGNCFCFPIGIRQSVFRKGVADLMPGGTQEPLRKPGFSPRGRGAHPLTPGLIFSSVTILPFRSGEIIILFNSQPDVNFYPAKKAGRMGKK
jgi:hypothetical protein